MLFSPPAQFRHDTRFSVATELSKWRIDFELSVPVTFDLVRADAAREGDDFVIAHRLMEPNRKGHG